jgi:hypothetical protein
VTNRDPDFDLFLGFEFCPSSPFEMRVFKDIDGKEQSSRRNKRIKNIFWGQKFTFDYLHLNAMFRCIDDKRHSFHFAPVPNPIENGRGKPWNSIVTSRSKIIQLQPNELIKQETTCIYS